MIEQYIYNKITQDSALQTLLDDGDGGYKLFPTVVPRGVETDKAVTFTLINSNDAYPKIQSVNVQFNIFADTHTEVAQISEALADLFNEDNNQLEAGVGVVYSQRVSQTDLGFNFDDENYQREATYYFKLR